LSFLNVLNAHFDFLYHIKCLQSTLIAS